MKNKKLLRIVMTLCLLGMSAFSFADPDPNFHIYLCFGQSNMEGAASIPNSEKQGISDRFQLLFSANSCSSDSNKKKGQWCTAIPPLAHCGAGFGPVDNFGRTLVDKLDKSIKVGVVVVAVGGADIKLFESGAESYVSGEADWFKNIAANYDNNGYKRLVEMAKIAQKDGVIKGILVHQGETNSGQSTWPNRLKAVYENLLNDLGLNAKEVPLLVGEVRYTGPCSGHNNVIRTVPNVISTAHVISADGCEAAGDQYHFSVAGYKTLGARYAEKMLELLGDNPVAQKDLSLAAVPTKESAPGEVEISITKENSAIKSVKIYVDDKVVATDVESYTVENLSEGKHTFYAVGYDSSNKEYKSTTSSVTIMPEQKPFNGTPAKIPGKIEAEEYDYGGEGNAYHDNDDTNKQTGATREDGVDVNSTIVGNTEPGEWLEYTVEVEEDGEYILESRVSSQSGDGQFTMYMDNTFIVPGADGTPGGFIDVPNTGSYNTFTTVTTKLKSLTKGVHVLKVEITSSWADYDYFVFKKAGDSNTNEEQNNQQNQENQENQETQNNTIVKEELLTGVTTGKYVDIKVQNRTVSIYAPKNAHTNRPLMISCHGRDQDINYQRQQTQWETVADTADFIVAYPAAIQRGSNVDWDIQGSDDTDFIQEVIQTIYKTYKIDLTRVYLSGFSMGGMFTYHCMNNIPDVFAAFAPISGYFGNTVNASTRAVPLIHTHGTSDGVVSFPASNGWAGAEAIVKGWADHNKTTQVEKYTVESANVTRYYGGECDADAILAAVPGRDHEPTNRSYHTSREIWKFVRQYSTACGKGKAALQIVLNEIKNNDPGEVEVSVSIVDENIKSVVIYVDNKKVGDGSKVVTLSDLSEGSHSVVATGYDSNNQEVASVSKTITIHEAQKPYNGTPSAIPGTIEAEEYDKGGEGNAYHDMEEDNQKKGPRNEGVDASSTAVGYTQKGEWIEYTVDVEKSGTYSFEAKVASGNDGASFTLYMDNVNIIPSAKSISVPNTGSWDDFTTVKSNLETLKKGTHVLKIEVTGDYFDIDNMTFTLVKAIDDTGLDLIGSDDAILVDGIYKAFDVTGRFVRNVNVYNGQCDELKTGFYILVNANGASTKFIAK